MIVAVTVSVMNLLVDLCYAAVDPRVKAGFKSKVKALKAKTLKEGVEA